MKIYEAVKSKKRCYRAAKPGKVFDFGNPAYVYPLDGWDLAADDWAVEDDERARLRLEVEQLRAELAAEKAKGRP
jgi:hypothetical protein